MFLPRNIGINAFIEVTLANEAWLLNTGGYLFSDRTRTGPVIVDYYRTFESNPNCYYLVSMSSGSTSSLLSYPVSEPEPSTSYPLPRSTPPRELLKNRLYVGNLHPTVDECAYTLSRANKTIPNWSLPALDTPSYKSSPSSGNSRVSTTSFTRLVHCAASPEATPLLSTRAMR